MKTQPMAFVTGERLDIEEAMDALRSTITPHPLVVEVDRYANASRYRFRLAGVKLCAILEAEKHDDGQVWAHLSVSAQSPPRIPSWRELGWAKQHFLGDRKAIQVLPPRSEYINLNPHVLNLYACLARDPLPDFRLRDVFTGEVGV